jgi:hypothetical protein
MHGVEKVRWLRDSFEPELSKVLALMPEVGK